MAQSSHYDDPFGRDGFEDFVDQTMKKYFAPGLAIAVVHGEETFAKGYGFANIEAKEPVTPNTLFYAGSTGKSFLSAAVSKLIYTGKHDQDQPPITWTTKLSSLIRDDFVLEDPLVTEQITIADALSHRTGLSSHDYSWLRADLSPQSIVRQLRFLPLHNEIRTTWEYCNLMFFTVQHAIEVVTGRGLGSLIKDWLWTPLGMRETFWTLDEALEYADQTNGVTMSVGYAFDNDTKSLVPQSYSIIPPASGPGDLISTVLDYTRWIRVFLHPENASNPISADAVRDLTTPHMLMPSEDLGLEEPFRRLTYGLGLESGMYRSHELVMHDGSISGWKTKMLWIPSLDWGCVLMQNAGDFAFEVVAWRLIDDFLRTPNPERFDMSGLIQRLRSQKEAKLANARKTLFPEAGQTATRSPSLPISAYEGRYSHPAYGIIQLHRSENATNADDAQIITLNGRPGQDSFLDVSFKFSHVEGEFWYARRIYGLSTWLTESLLKAKFELGVSGKVEALHLQIEPAMDNLAIFAKI